MTRVDDINEQIAKLEAERESGMLEEQANVLVKMRLTKYRYLNCEVRSYLCELNQSYDPTSPSLTVLITPLHLTKLPTLL